MSHENSLLSVEEARGRLLAHVVRLATERVSLAEASFRVLAEDLLAEGNLPPFDCSAMDGYAVAVADLSGESPFSMPVSGEASAGGLPLTLKPGTACRIFTGAPLPLGADAVVMQEHVARNANTIRLEERPRAGQNVRRAGEDLPQGALALPAGTRLTPGGLALAAMLDRSQIVVVRRPRVTVLCTGDELRAAGDSPRPGSIPESNSASLAALARQAGAAVRIAPIVRDEPGATQRAIEEALDGTDVLVTVGGVSVGDRDLVRPALERAGVTLDFWRVAIRPGKPLAVGRSGSCRVLGLPGNPASALVTWGVFGMPLVRVLQGDLRPLPIIVRVRLFGNPKRGVDRTEFLRASLEQDNGQTIARAYGNQGSGAATNLARSDGLAIVPPGDGPLDSGTLVDFIRWNDL